MNQKKSLSIVVSMVLLIVGANGAGATIITFKETPCSTGTLIGSEWSAYGITTTNVYRYNSSVDLFDGCGISQTSNVPPGRIDFTIPTDAVTVDWLTNGANNIYINAYGAGNNLLDSFSSTGSGTETLTGPGISYITFHDATGFVGISTLSFIPNNVNVPEFPTMALPVVSVLGLMFIINRKKK